MVYQLQIRVVKMARIFYFIMFIVYILYSEKHNKHYTGLTSDLEARIKSHNELGTKDWSRKYRPWKLLHTEEFETKSEALKREKWFKSGAGREFMKKLKH